MGSIIFSLKQKSIEIIYFFIKKRCLILFSLLEFPEFIFPICLDTTIEKLFVISYVHVIKKRLIPVTMNKLVR